MSLPLGALLALLTPLAPGPGSAPSVVLFGGGWGPEGTQVSMEQQLLELTKVFAAREPLVLFAAGDPRARVVQIAAAERDEVGELLGMLFEHRENLSVSYRPTVVHAVGAASRSGLLEAIDRSRGEAAGVVVLGVGHGSQATADEPAALDLWGPDDRLYADELAEHLDETNRDGPVALVLGHCYSGGFLDVVHQRGDPQARLAQPARCVMAAVPQDLTAAGCTPDLADPSARSYMALIAEAFQKPAESDYDHDGRVALNEAHAYARIHDPTVDVPVASSALWLRGRMGDKSTRWAAVRWTKLLERVRPAERAVLSALAPAGADPIAAGSREEGELARARSQLEQELGALRDSYDKSRRVLLDKVLSLWPELANPYHGTARRLLGGDEVPGFVRSTRELRDLRALDTLLAGKEEEKLVADKKWALRRRWLDALAAAVDEESFRKSAPRREVEGFERLLSCEAMAPLPRAP